MPSRAVRAGVADDVIGGLSLFAAGVPDRSTTGAGRWVPQAATRIAAPSIAIRPGTRIEVLLGNAAPQWDETHCFLAAANESSTFILLRNDKLLFVNADRGHDASAGRQLLDPRRRYRIAGRSRHDRIVRCRLRHATRSVPENQPKVG
jgi:hypothetical protein